jgi:hypothetical protein
MKRQAVFDQKKNMILGFKYNIFPFNKNYNNISIKNKKKKEAFLLLLIINFLNKVNFLFFFFTDLKILASMSL